MSGTMLFGESTSYPEACQLLSLGSEGGINTFDSAEMYPVPQRPETQGRSEEFLGSWLKPRRRWGAHMGACFHACFWDQGLLMLTPE